MSRYDSCFSIISISGNIIQRTGIQELVKLINQENAIDSGTVPRVMIDTSGDTFHWQHSNEYVINYLSQKIRDNMTRYYPDLAAAEITVSGRPWGGQETARTFRFEIRSTDVSAQQVVFSKLCPIFPTMNPALMEYETLRLLYDKMPLVQEGCYVPRPLDYYPELNAYSMESVGTRSFKPYLLKSNSKLRKDDALADLFSIVGRSAAWLHAFHAITRSKKVTKFEHKTIIDSINEDFNYHSLRNFHFQKNTIQQLDHVMERLASLDNNYDLPCAKWHWDFTPGHVYLDNNRISVIDILGADDTPIYEDIGRFLASMTAINNFPFYPFYDYRRAEGPLCNRFTESYASDTGYDKELFQCFTNIYKLKYLIIWFFSQHLRVSSKINPVVGNAFANLRLVQFYEKPILNTIQKINERI